MDPIEITERKIYKELSPSPVDWLLAVVGDKIRIETKIQIANYAIASTDKPFKVAVTDGYITPAGQEWLTDDYGRFSIFNIGDSVAIYAYDTNTLTCNAIIVNKDGNSGILIDTPTGFASNLDIATLVISLKTPITAIKYYSNYIENNASDNFNSPIDGTEHLWVAESKLGGDTSTTAMEPIGTLEGQDGSANVTGISAGISGSIYITKYKITHYTKVTPYLLETQIANQEAGIYPKDFKNLSCWKLITKVEAAVTYTDPNFIVSEIFDGKKGNTGWYGENYNTAKSNYSISDLYYSNGGKKDSAVLGTGETFISFKVKNTVDSPFTTSGTPGAATQFVLQMFKVPADPSEYINTGKLMDVNFIYDRALQTVGCAVVNGDNYGGDYQCLKNISAVRVSTSEIIINATINMTAIVVAAYQASSNPKYFLSLTTQKYGIDTTDGTNDLVTLEIDMNDFVVITEDKTMIVFDRTSMLRHPEADPETEGVIVGNGLVDPANLVWGLSVVGTGAVAAVDKDTNLVIGLADWTTDIDTTLALLVKSVTDGIAYGSNFTAQSFGANANNYTASYNATTNEFTITIPTGVGATYNGKQVFFAVNGGAWTITPAQLQTIAGGTDGDQFDVYPEDEIVACTEFYIESSGRTTDEIKLTQIKAQIIAKNGTKSFELDQFIMQLVSETLVGYTQQFDIQVARSFHIPAGTIRKYIEVKRRNDLDTGTRKYFSSNYPFLFRWEDWTLALGVDPAFFDSSLPNNGFNEWWYHYAQLSGWSLYYNFDVSATKNGALQQYTLQKLIVPHDYGSNADYTVKSVLAFDPDILVTTGTNTAKQLVTGGGGTVTINSQDFLTTGNQFVYGYKKTLIAAIFTKSTAPVSVNVVIGIEIWQQGGFYGKRRYSSKWVADSDTWFSSVDGDGKVKLNAYGNSVVAQCYLDPSSLNFPKNITAFKLTARIYEVGGTELTTDDGVVITDDDGVKITID